jgi:hypothetical protein
MVSADRNVDEEINQAVNNGPKIVASEHLEELKKKMGIG